MGTPDRWWRYAPGAVLGCLLLAYLATFVGRAPGYWFVSDGLLANLIMGMSAAVCLGRAALVRTWRLPFVLFGLTAAAFAAGNAVHVFHDRLLDPVPYPSWADACYLVGYPLLLAGVVALAWPELSGMSLGSYLDGVLGALSCSVALSILTVQPVLRTLHGDVLKGVVGAAYPVLDLVLVAMVVGVMTLKGGRPGPVWLWLTACVGIEAVTDTVYLHQIAEGRYVIGTDLDAGWVLGLAVLAMAALSDDRPDRRRQDRQAQVLLLPNVFSVAAVAILIYGSLLNHELPWYAVLLTMVGLLTAVKRTSVGFSALKLLAASQRQAQTDELTQLANRRAFDQQFQRMLLHRSPEAHMSVVMVDLDGFKAINDTFGHHAGDELLRQIAARLRQSLRTGDLLARLGGDEFGLVLLSCDRADALMIGERLVAEVSRPMLIDGEVQTAGASVGIAVCPEDGSDMHTLLQRADAAMFDAKANRRGATTWDPHRHEADRSRLNVREAVEQHQLVLHYQPQFDLRTGRLVGAEALVRWGHPTRGLLFPDSFLSFFEQAGMMSELTLEVIDVACKARAGWLREGHELELSVNLAPSALLRSDLVPLVAEVLRRYSMPAAALTIEITENAMMMDIDRSRQALRALRDLGLRLSLDDYGTGYASLTYLRDLPLAEVKIDRSFVMHMVPGTNDAAIVSSSIQLGQSLGLRVVAEGVETIEALSMLRDMGCDAAQGYLIGRPVPTDELLVSADADLAGLRSLAQVPAARSSR